MDNGLKLIHRGYRILDTFETAKDYFSSLDILHKTIKNINVYTTGRISQKMFDLGEQLPDSIYYQHVYERLRFDSYGPAVLVFQFEDDSYLCIDTREYGPPSAKYSRNLVFEYHILNIYPSYRYVDAFNCLKGLYIRDVRLLYNWSIKDGDTLQGIYFNIDNHDSYDGTILNNEDFVYNDAIGILEGRRIAYYTNRDF